VVRRWLTSQELDSRSPPGALLAENEQATPIFVSAVVGDGQVGGFVIIQAERAAPDELDQLAAERAALVCAVEMAKQQAVSAAEERLRGDFLNVLLTAGVSEAPIVERRALEMGYSLQGHHVALLLDLGESPARARDVAGREIGSQFGTTKVRTLTCTHGSGLAVLCHADDRNAWGAIEAQARAICGRTMAIVPAAKAVIGIGGRGEGLGGLRQSFNQAQETLSLALELFDGGGVLTYGELPLYHLLRRLQDCEELEAFRRQTLAALEAYDRDHDAELVTTLEAYFRHFGNVSQTASSLHLHRNSLIYRLERLGDITGLNLDDEEDRFALQLALKLRPFVSQGH
jgi:purine catabolism regulator